MPRLKKILWKTLKVLALLLLPVVIYGIYVAPVFLEYGGGAGCFNNNDERRNSSHSDYVRLLQWVKWRHTVLCGIGPPVQDAGNQDFHVGPDHKRAPKPIPPAGQWQWSHTDVQTKFWNVRLDYIAITLPGQYHARLGWRWDDVDNIYFFTLSAKKIPINLDLQLFYWVTNRYLG